MDKSNHDETSSVYQDAQRQLLLTYNDFSIECFKVGVIVSGYTVVAIDLSLNRAA